MNVAGNEKSFNKCLTMVIVYEFSPKPSNNNIKPNALSSLSNPSKSTRMTDRNVTYTLIVKPIIPAQTANSKKFEHATRAKLAAKIK